MNVSNFSNIYIARYLFFLIFSFAYIIKTYISTFDGSIVLSSDFLNYFLFYNSSVFQIDRWGVEIITPILFWFGGLIGLDFFEFVYVVGVFWLIPIYFLSKYVRVEYLALYYMFFLVWFAPQYAFLFRQYFSILFTIFFFSLSKRYRYILFLLSILSHFSIIIVYIFSFIKFKRRFLYVVASITSVFSFISYKFGFSVLSFFVGGVYQTGIKDIDRKINILNELERGYSSGSFMVYLVLCFATILHSFKIEIKGPTLSLERAFYFSALSSLILSEFVILSNRVGILAYFFSIPYLSIVLSKYVVRFNINKGDAALIPLNHR